MTVKLWQTGRGVQERVGYLPVRESLMNNPCKCGTKDQRHGLWKRWKRCIFFFQCKWNVPRLKCEAKLQMQRLLKGESWKKGENKNSDKKPRICHESSWWGGKTPVRSRLALKRIRILRTIRCRHPLTWGFWGEIIQRIPGLSPQRPRGSGRIPLNVGDTCSAVCLSKCLHLKPTPKKTPKCDFLLHFLLLFRKTSQSRGVAEVISEDVCLFRRDVIRAPHRLISRPTRHVASGRLRLFRGDLGLKSACGQL